MTTLRTNGGEPPEQMVYYFSFNAGRCFTRPLKEFIANVYESQGSDQMSDFATLIPRFKPL